VGRRIVRKILIQGGEIRPTLVTGVLKKLEEGGIGGSETDTDFPAMEREGAAAKSKKMG